MDKKEFDFFISHSSLDKAKVEGLVAALEKRGVRCWYAPRDVKGRYAKAITEAIQSSKILLLCLSNNSAVSEQVLNEVEFAYKKCTDGTYDIQIEPLLIDKDFNIDAPGLEEMCYYVKRIQFIIPSNVDSSMEIADSVISKHADSLKINAPKPVRNESKYYIVQKTKGEDKRLRIQNELTKRFDGEVYKEIFSGSDIDILDVGCGDGDVILDRLETYASKYRLCAFDRDEEKIKLAQTKHSNGNTSFFSLDITEEDFKDKLERKCQEFGVSSFDVIHISMVLLHLKDPVCLLRVLRRYLKPSGVIFIKDIDDGINFAYPDEDGAFDRICEICSRSELSGFRHSGRQIHHYLMKSGFKNISLRKQGLSSAGFSYDEKENFFNMYCQFVYDDIEWMHNKYPDNKQYDEDHRWYKENYKLINDRFLEDDFVFCLGFQIYLAKR